MNQLILILGGARSGKSEFAEQLALRLHRLVCPDEPVAYIATAERMDAEFAERIAYHRERRGMEFRSIEEPLAIDTAVGEALGCSRIVLLECITTWLGNHYYKNGGEESETGAMETIDRMIAGTGRLPASPALPDTIPALRAVNISEIAASLGTDGRALILVSNELGLGIVPADSETRAYRDTHGRINRRIALNADYVFFTLAGQPVRIK